MQVTTIGLDLAKHWFQVHGVDANLQRIKSFCGAKPPQKLRWTNAGRRAACRRYGDFSRDARPLG